MWPVTPRMECHILWNICVASIDHTACILTVRCIKRHSATATRCLCTKRSHNGVFMAFITCRVSSPQDGVVYDYPKVTITFIATRYTQVLQHRQS